MVAKYATLAALMCAGCGLADSLRDIRSGFSSPPESARPWVYWMVMDGNLTREGITADLEAMKRAGIGGATFLEVDLGLPRGSVKFMNPEWRGIFTHAVRESERLGIEIALPTGPGWCGAGGPWVAPDQTMQHLVASETNVVGPTAFSAVLSRPQPRAPFFGMSSLTPEYEKIWREYYRDVAVVAFPTPESDQRLPDIDEKAIYQRAPYSSFPGVKSYLPMSAEYPGWPQAASISRSNIVELTPKLQANGQIAWDVPPGKWTIVRFGRTVTGQLTRPAPLPGLGFEVSKFDAVATRDHLEKYVGTLLDEVGHKQGARPSKKKGGLTHLHFDSWEMSSQNWSPCFRAEFTKRRGYDLLPFMPAYTGRVVESRQITERFLWDVRQTGQELTVENHIKPMRDMAHRNGMLFSIEPYDMNPNSDMLLGSVADVPMCEFWWLGFNTTYSVIEAASVAHTMGRPIVAAESFTSEPGEDWQGYPEVIKSLGDWAFASGVNRIVFHRFQHQPWLDRYPGMRMGPYGIHWDRTQTFWSMLRPFHQYLARCQFMLRQGQPVADILFLAGEGAPHVFRAPASATVGNPPDRRGYNFDGCAPEVLLARASAVDGRIQFSNAVCYKILVLPEFDTMTPALLRKVEELARGGVTIIGPPPRTSPGLSGYPQCDSEIAALAAKLWSKQEANHVLWGPEFAAAPAAAVSRHPLEGAMWIWRDEGDPAATAPVGTRWFTREITLPEVTNITKAVLHVTADNAFQLIVNKKPAGGGSNFTEYRTIDIKPFLKPGANVVSLRVDNSGDAANPAGVIANGEIVVRGADPVGLQTGHDWNAAADATAPGAPARELGEFGMAPWGRPRPAPEGQHTPPTYAPYDAIAFTLARRGLAEDFQSSAPIRHTHRATPDSDIYFLANRTEETVRAECVFRVNEAQPELWNPTDGSTRPLHHFKAAGGRTEIALKFEPLESYFIVFCKTPKAASRPGPDFPALAPLKLVEGPWTVSFSDAWGERRDVVFDALQDWSKHKDDSIRHFSGTATYRKTLQLTDAEIKEARGRQAFLELGAVKNIATVRVNGKDLGTAWCAPWRVALGKTLKPGRNEIEISVANLWINRLIGDAGLPEIQRQTWTSHNPYKPGSSLVPAGLLGPVRLVRERQD